MVLAILIIACVVIDVKYKKSDEMFLVSEKFTEEEKVQFREHVKATVETEPQTYSSYDFKYCDKMPLTETLQKQIYDICHARNFDYWLALAIIKAESEFDVNAVGDSGQAIGLCQIWSSVWGDMASRNNLKLEKPIDNVYMMILIMELHIRQTGCVDQALRVYNAGDLAHNNYGYVEKVHNNYREIEGWFE